MLVIDVCLLHTCACYIYISLLHIHLLVTHMCLLHTCACYIHALVTYTLASYIYICLLHTCAYYIHVLVTCMCLLHTCLLHLCAYYTRACSTHVLVTYIYILVTYMPFLTEYVHADDSMPVTVACMDLGQFFHMLPASYMLQSCQHAGGCLLHLLHAGGMHGACM